MPRANRQFLPGYIWHVTHRCHNQEFLLRYRNSREEWLQQLGIAKRRFELRVLNYIATSNHVHLIIFDPNGDTLPRAMQWVAGRTGEIYNQKHKRSGAFWSDRYHATAIEKGDYLWRCMLYINLNMVRAGVVSHPENWFPSGYNEIQMPKNRYGILSWPDLLELFEMDSRAHFQQIIARQIDDALQKGDNRQNSNWSESLAVGQETFLQTFAQQLGYRAKNKTIHQLPELTYIREPASIYSRMADLPVLKGDNCIYWTESL